MDLPWMKYDREMKRFTDIEREREREYFSERQTDIQSDRKGKGFGEKVRDRRIGKRERQ